MAYKLSLWHLYLTKVYPSQSETWNWMRTNYGALLTSSLSTMFFNWLCTLNRGIYYVPWFSFWMPPCNFKIVSTLHPKPSWGPAGLNFMQPCNFTHWSTRSSRCSCTCDWHPLNGSLLYTLLTPFCCSKTPQKNSPLYTVRNKSSNLFAEFDSEKLNAVHYLWPNFEENCQKAKF